MKKIFVFTIGGLGNQIWIWNHIYNIKKQCKLLIVDISWFKWYSCLFFNFRRKTRKSYHEIFAKLNPEIKIKDSPIRLLIFQINNKFNKLFRRSFKDYYFQDKKEINSYFKDVLSDYLAQYMIEILKKESIDIQDLKNSIGLHIRLGDRGDLSNQELKHIENKLKLIKINSSIYLFSDESNLAKEIISRITNASTKQLKNNNELVNFCCLSLCKTIIETRESSYSFWARELSLKMRSKI